MGGLERAKLEMVAPDFMVRQIFCCGLAPYMLSVRSLLADSGFDMNFYREESFGATPAEVTQDALEQAEIAVREAEEIRT